MMADVPRPETIDGLVSEHLDAVYRYAFRLTGQSADAEDLTQQTFLVAQQKSGQLRDRSAARGWLCAILRSLVAKLYRNRREIDGTSLDWQVETVAEDVDPDPEAPLVLEELQAAIDQLPPDFKEVLLLFYFEQCSYRQIAAKLDLPPGTVMSRLSRAKAHLRRRLIRPSCENTAARAVQITSRPGGEA